MEHAVLYGPVLLFLYTVYALQKYPPYLSAYFAGIVANMVVNFIAKYIIREPKPIQDNMQIHSAFQYGMPSFFTQIACFSAVYLYQVLHCSFHIFFFAGIIVLFTGSYQYIHRMHTPAQILAGMALGSLLAYVVFATVYHHLHSPVFAEPDK